MKNKGLKSLRHVQIDKDNTVIVASVAIAAACLMFSLVAAQALWKQAGYNRKVISAKEEARNTVEQNVANLETLETSYKAFVEQPTNIIGGSKDGTGDRDGDNAKIVLDSMPSVYDFPGTITGFNKVLNTGEFGQVTIGASDEEITQKQNITPTPVDLVMSFSATTTVEGVQGFINRNYNLIRPVKINNISISGASDGQLSVSFNANTYFQPKKQFSVTTEEVK